MTGRVLDVKMEIGGAGRNWAFEGQADRFNAIECTGGSSTASTLDWAPYLSCSSGSVSTQAISACLWAPRSLSDGLLVNTGLHLWLPPPETEH